MSAGDEKLAQIDETIEEISDAELRGLARRYIRQIRELQAQIEAGWEREQKFRRRAYRIWGVCILVCVGCLIVVVAR